MTKMGFLFPGQGSQYVGMGQKLCEEFAIARETFAEANQVLGFDLQKLCFSGDIDELTKTENAQPAILTGSVAALRVFQEVTGLVPLFAAGHSLGEYSALVSAGAIRFTDALQIVRKRGQFMQQAVPIGEGTMLAVMNLPYSLIQDICADLSTAQEKVVVANYNSNTQIVISGHLQAVAKAKDKLVQEGGFVKELQVSAPFHSPLMQPAADLLALELEKYQFGKMKWPVISNVTALPYQKTDQLVKNLTDQIVQPVLWHKSMEYLQNRGLDLLIELGPGSVLKKLVEKSDLKMKVLNFANTSELEGMQEELPKVDLTGLIVKSMTVLISTKNHNPDDLAYEEGVLQPYRQIEAIVKSVQVEEREATLEEAYQVLDLLKKGLATKEVPIEEQWERLVELFALTATSRLLEDFEL